jgi:hypothetical protein
MNTYLTNAHRNSLVDQYVDCYEETGGEDSIITRIYLERLSNSELVKECNKSGWDIN